MDLLDPRCACFELRNLGDWIERRVCQLIDGQVLAPMIRNEDRVLANCFDYQSWKDPIAAPGDYAHALAIVHLELHRCLWMNLDVWFGTLLNEKSYAPCLIAGQVLIDNATAGQNQRELFVRRFLRRLVLDCVKLRLAIGMIETVFEQARSARMIERRAWPKDTVLLFDLLPCDSVVIGVAAARSDAHLVENGERAIKVKILFPAHATRYFLNNPPVSARLARRVCRFVDLQNPAFT